MRILFFIESLGCGGKERRLLELIQYLKQHTDYEISLVLTEDIIHYDYVYNLGITIKIIRRKTLKKDPLIFIKFYRYCCFFKPDIIHTWGFMNTFYSIPTKLILKVPLISSMITIAKRGFKQYSFSSLFFHASCFFSDAIISNSRAGLQAFKINSPKAKVIYNGVRLERFQQNFNQKEVRDLHGIKTVFMIVMVASFSTFKDYDLFLDVARELGEIRNDVTFLGVGDGEEWLRINQRIKDEQIHNVVLTGNKKVVEPIIAASDLGLLCTFSEGVSNSIIEYMALGKPVITTDVTGGSKEIVVDNETGFLAERNSQKVVDLITTLLNNEELRKTMGEKGEERIKTFFSIERMGEEFVSLYSTFV